MSKENLRSFGLMLIGLGALVVPAMTVVYSIFNPSFSWIGQLEAASVGGMMVLIGALALIGQRVQTRYESSLNEHVGDGVQDDLHDLSKFRITWTQLLLATSAISVLVLMYYLNYYQKWDAMWGNVSVLFVAVTLSLLVAIFIVTTDWFRDQHFRTPIYVYVIVLFGLIGCGWAGIYGTEPITTDGAVTYPRGGEYNYQYTRAYVWVNQVSGGDASGIKVKVPKIPTSSCTGKGCGYTMLFVLLVVVIFFFFILSLLVSHFWVVAGLVLATVLVMMAIQDLLAIVPQDERG